MGLPYVLIDLDSLIKFGETATCTRNSRVTQVKVVIAATNYIIVPLELWKSNWLKI